MAIVLSHTTAAAILASPLAERGETLHHGYSSLESFATPTPTDPAVIETLKSQLHQPIHILVPPNSSWKRTRTIIPHEFGGALEPGNLWHLTDSVLLCGPALSFIQTGTHMPELDHLLYGYQLCGAHALDEIPGGIVQRRPLALTAELGSFIERHPCLRGARIARNRMRYLRDGAASPMESALALRLLLPRKRNGMGIASLVLNHCIEVPAHLHRLAGCRRFYLDVFIPKANIGLEYDSDAFHAAPEKIARDATRRNILEGLGIRMITVTRRQLLDADEFRSVAESINALLGRRTKTLTTTSVRREREFSAELRGALSRMKPRVSPNLMLP